MTSPFSSFHASGRPLFAGRAADDVSALQAAWATRLAAGSPPRLDDVSGPFAVALKDSSGRVVMAVDRFGIESLCYTVRGGALQVATRADELGGAAPELDPQAIFDYLYFHAIPSPRTVFKDVFRLPPGHVAVWDAGRLSVQPYWVPTFTPARSASFGALRDEFRSLLQTAVADQLDGSRPACYLSGGTDSSTVAGMIRQASGARPATYSIGFDAAGYDEMAFARIAARHFDTEHHEYYVTPDELVASIPKVAVHYDQPFGNSSAVPAYCCARMARDDGVTRLLAGDGGDELFGGNKRYAVQRVLGWYDEFPPALRRHLLEPVFERSPLARVPGFSKVASYIRQASVPLPDRLQTYNLLTRLGIGDVLERDFLARVDAQAPQRQQREVWSLARTPHRIDRNLAFDWRYTLAENDLPKVVGSSSLAGVSVGFPMLDQRLLDFSSRLPPSYKLRGLKLRWFFKEALRGFLPDEIIVKKKQGFGLPFGVWATTHGGLQALARDSLGSLATRGIVRPAFIESLLRERLPEHPGYYGEMVWILLMLEQWLRRHAPAFRLQG